MLRIRTASHLHAETILTHDFTGEHQELLEAFGATSLPLREAEPFTLTGRPTTPKRQRRGTRHILLPIDQAAWNLHLDQTLREAGWQSQPFVLGEPTGSALDSYLQGDFAKNRVFVEVEFGNTASLFRDLFKFQIAGRSRVGDIGVLVVASSNVARFFDSGVATFEQAVNLLPYMSIGIQLPIWIVGLDLDDWESVKSRYEQMYEVATANGVECYPFEEVWRAPIVDASGLESASNP